MKTLVKRLILTATTILLMTGYSFAQNTVDGHLTYHNSWPMGNSTVQLMDMSGNILQSASTDGTGYFLFPNVPSGDYQMTATTQLPAGGIDMGDAYLIMMHLFNLYPFNSIEAITADVDGDGAVTWNDYFAIVVGWFTQGYPFPAGEWTFETLNFSLSGAREGFSGNFGGSSTGDVNHSLIPDKTGIDRNFVTKEYLATAYKTSDVIDIPMSVSSHSGIGAAFIEISYPKELNISSVTPDFPITFITSESDIYNFNYSIEGNALKISLINNEIDNSLENIEFTISIDPSILALGEYDFTISSQSHFIDNSGNRIYGVEVTLPSLKLEEEEETITPLQKELSCKSYPNPFKTNVTIELNVPIPDSYKVFIHNGTGQTVHETNYTYYEEGQNQINIDMVNNLPGIYFYSIINRDKSAVIQGSMIKL